MSSKHRDLLTFYNIPQSYRMVPATRRKCPAIRRKGGVIDPVGVTSEDGDRMNLAHLNQTGDWRSLANQMGTARGIMQYPIPIDAQQVEDGRTDVVR